MNLSVVVPTLNSRDRLAAGLDALAAHAPAAEVIVVNGPSVDGTTGMVLERNDVSVLVEISDRNLNVARNAGLAAATGDAVALVDHDSTVEGTWLDGVREAVRSGADVVTGPVHRQVRAGVTTESVESATFSGREVTYFDGGNVVLSRAAIETIDGFDEYLVTGGARDAAHRLAGLEFDVEWSPDVSVLREYGNARLSDERDWGWKYRALAYRLTKNYGVHPVNATCTFRNAFGDALTSARHVLAGDVAPSSWLRNGRDVVTNMGIGYKDGLLARARDRTPTRNPRGLSTRANRAVERYDWR